MEMVGFTNLFLIFLPIFLMIFCLLSTLTGVLAGEAANDIELLAVDSLVTFA